MHKYTFIQEIKCGYQQEQAWDSIYNDTKTKTRNRKYQDSLSRVHFSPEVCFGWRNSHETYFGRTIRKWHKENKLQSAPAENLRGGRRAEVAERRRGDSGRQTYWNDVRDRCRGYLSTSALFRPPIVVSIFTIQFN